MVRLRDCLRHREVLAGANALQRMSSTLLVICFVLIANYSFCAAFTDTRIGGLPSGGKVENGVYYVGYGARYKAVSAATFKRYATYERVADVLFRVSLATLSIILAVYAFHRWRTAPRAGKICRMHSHPLRRLRNKGIVMEVVAVAAFFATMPLAFAGMLFLSLHRRNMSITVFALTGGLVTFAYVGHFVSKRAWKEHYKIETDTTLCIYCGYSLVGNVSGVCPECGHFIGGSGKSNGSGVNNA